MLDLQPIKARRERYNHLGTDISPAGQVIAMQQADIAALIEEVERVRAENAWLRTGGNQLNNALNETSNWACKTADGGFGGDCWCRESCWKSNKPTNRACVIANEAKLAWQTTKE